MPAYRSRTSTHGRNMAGARGLWRATGMKDGDFGKPIIAIANSFTQFVPGHVHLKDLGQLVAREVEKAGGVAKEFNTIAVDDGIAMGHDGMLYSLPSREIIADSVEYMVNAHCADALICISNCDKITPGMLMAALRLNIPAVFVSGGPMEAGKVTVAGKIKKVDLIDAMVAAADPDVSDADVAAIERSACPTCGSCSGMFTANSMNCLTEALGSRAARQRHDRRNPRRPQAAVRRGRPSRRRSRAPLLRAGRRKRAAAQHRQFRRLRKRDDARYLDGRLDQHRAASARRRLRGRHRFHHERHRPPVAPRPGAVQGRAVGARRSCRGRASRRRHHGHSRRTRPRRAAQPRHADGACGRRLGAALERNDIKRSASASVREFFQAAPGGVPTQVAFSQASRYETLDEDRAGGVIRDLEHAFSKDGGLAVLCGNLAEDGCIVKTAGVDSSILKFAGPVKLFESQDDAVSAILGRQDRGRAMSW